jgi:hypothetical protein
MQGGHILLHLPTNAVIERRRIVTVPITPAIIQYVHRIAETEGMPNGLKLHNRQGVLFYDAAWIAGVDYDEEAFDDEVDAPYSDSDSDQDDDELPDHQFESVVDNDNLTVVDESEDDSDDNDDLTVVNESKNDSDDNEEVPANEPNDDPDDPDEVSDEDEQSSVKESNPSTDNDKEVSDEEEETEMAMKTRSGRVIKPPSRLTMVNHLFTQAHPHREEYSIETARIIAMVMCRVNDMAVNPHKQNCQFIQTYSLSKGLKKFGQRGHDAAFGEMKQLHNRVVFVPTSIDSLTSLERKRAMESLIFLVEKRDGRVKARTCANGSTQREYTDRDEAASPTVMTEAVLITGVIEAKQRRDVMTADIPNAFVQTDVGKRPIGERIIMKIRGPLVDMLVALSPETYEPYVVYEGKSKVLYVIMEKALYGMLQSSLLYYKKFRADIESIGFIVNPYDPCVANRMADGKQHTVTWHVDDLKSSHVNSKVNDEFLKWLKLKYASDTIGEVKAVRGHRHDYLAMWLDYSTPGVLKLDMTYYVKAMIDDFPDKLEGTGKYPWTNNLFVVDPKSKLLDDKRKAIFHTFVMKGMFLCKRGRQDVQPAIAFLSTRTTEPNENDWKKLKKMLMFLKATQDEVMCLSADDSNSVYWTVDAAFAVHNDMKSHTGATLSFGTGVVNSVSTKQKVNSRSSTEAELIGIDDVLSKILWTKLFIEAQGLHVKENIVFRDNTSSMKLEENGKASSGKRTRHFNIKYFYVTDLIKRGEFLIKYCHTDAILADYYTKPLVGTKFFSFRKMIMGIISFFLPA